MICPEPTSVEPPTGVRPTIIVAVARLYRSPTFHELFILACCRTYRPVKLNPDEARIRLASSDHGVLCTVHLARGVDAVPVVYAVDDGYVGVPVDRVKPKTSSRLQRARNLESDPRAALLVEHWDRQDWSQLWWVRAELRRASDEPTERAAALAARLADLFPQYRDQPFTTVIVLQVVAVTGWAAR